MKVFNFDYIYLILFCCCAENNFLNLCYNMHTKNNFLVEVYLKPESLGLNLNSATSQPCDLVWVNISMPLFPHL